MKTPQLQERLNAFHLRSCARQRCLISPLLFSIVLEVLPSAIIEERDPYDPAIPLLGIYLKKQKHQFKKIHASKCSQELKKKFFFIGVQLIYKAVLVSSVQQSESVIHIHVSTLFKIIFLYRPLQSIDQSSLCYTAGSCQ